MEMISPADRINVPKNVLLLWCNFCKKEKVLQYTNVIDNSDGERKEGRKEIAKERDRSLLWCADETLLLGIAIHHVGQPHRIGRFRLCARRSPRLKVVAPPASKVVKPSTHACL